MAPRTTPTLADGPRGAAPGRAPDPAIVADRLRLPVTRLARLLRQQDSSGLGPTLTSALATIGREGPLTVSELAQSEQVAPATISRAVAKLEQRGMVDRSAVEGDGRSFLLRLTPEGRAQLDANRSRRQAWLSMRLAELGDDELRRLEDIVEVLEHLTEVTR